MGGKASLQDLLITQQHKEETIQDIVDSRPSDSSVKLAFGAFTKK